MQIDVQKNKRSELKEYFLQFLMLFLAVLLGTVSENYRENYSNEVKERTMERETLKALANDLNTDIINLEKSIKNKAEKEEFAKKLVEFISSKLTLLKKISYNINIAVNINLIILGHKF